MKIIGTVEKIDCPTRRSFDALYADCRRPVIVRGAIDDWPALGRWDLEYLTSVVGDAEVRYTQSPSGKHPDFGASRQEPSGAMRFAEVARHLVDPDALRRTRYSLVGDAIKFLHGSRTNAALAPLTADFRIPALVDEASLGSIGFWLTAGGVKSWLHYDAVGQHNLNAQVTGRKRFLVFPAEQIPRLYLFRRFADPDSGERHPHHFSQIDVHGPEVDLARFPRFADAECFTGVLEAGEMLFIPACWPHAFEHLGAINANVNFWWRPHWIELNPASLRQGLFDAILALSSDALESARTAAAPAAAGATADPRFLEVCQGLERACLAWRRSERRTRA